VDDDCIPDQNLIAVYRDAALENPGIGVFEGRISAVGEPSSYADVAPINETGGKLWSCNFAIRRELFVKIDGFDDRYPFPAMEDIDLYWRVKKHSQVLFLPDARVWHAFEMRLGWKIVRPHLFPQERGPVGIAWRNSAPEGPRDKIPATAGFHGLCEPSIRDHHSSVEISRAFSKTVLSAVLPELQVHPIAPP
jgi:hypothetical protein